MKRNILIELSNFKKALVLAEDTETYSQDEYGNTTRVWVINNKEIGFDCYDNRGNTLVHGSLDWSLKNGIKWNGYVDSYEEEAVYNEVGYLLQLN